ncbi:MAG: hypothetical protein RLZZ385_363 [Pseudomonadota bacterium]|jgi:hypothetical protein
MSSPVPLQNDKHAKLKINDSGDYTRYKNRHLIPIVAQDFFALAAEFPLVFVHNNDSGEFIPVAVMGLKEGQNLYCQTPQYPAQVVPISFNNYPFSVVRTGPEEDSQLMVLIDEESPQLSETTGQALFNDKGERSDYLQGRVEALSNYAQQLNQTRVIVKLFADKKLFSTQQVQLQHRADGRRYNIDGIHVINEQALNELPDEDFLTLRKQGLLALIYSHLASLQQLRRVSRLQYEADKAAEAAN